MTDTERDFYETALEDGVAYVETLEDRIAAARAAILRFLRTYPEWDATVAQRRDILLGALEALDTGETS